MSKVLVTGSNGFIGSKLISMLQKKKYDVSGLDTCYYDSPTEETTIVGDIRDITESDLKGIDYVCHLAGLSGDNTADIYPHTSFDINYKASVKLAKLSKKCKVKRFIFASTCSVYGWQPDSVITELSPVDTNGPYSKSKFMTEKEIFPLHDKKFIVTCLRPATSYGSSKHLRCDLVINNLIAQACTKDIVEITSTGTQLRPVIHNEDFSAGFIACMEAPEELVNGEVFNLGRTIDNYTIKEMANKVCNVAHKQFKCTNVHPETKRNYRVSYEKIETILRDYYKPRYDLDNGIKVTYKWMKPIIKSGDYTTIYDRRHMLKERVKQGMLDTNYRWK